MTITLPLSNNTILKAGIGQRAATFTVEKEGESSHVTIPDKDLDGFAKFAIEVAAAVRKRGGK